MGYDFKLMTHLNKLSHTSLYIGLIFMGFFGALGAIFIAISAILFLFVKNENGNEIISRRKLMLSFLLITAVWFSYLLSGLVNNYNEGLLNIFYKLSSSISIPLVGMIIVSLNKIKITKEKLSLTAAASLISMAAITLFLETVSPENILSKHSLSITERLELFSGNAIPFSVSVFSLSLLSALNTYNSNRFYRTIAFLGMSAGLYSSTLLSGTRGTLLVLILVFPVLIYYLKRSNLFFGEILKALPFLLIFVFFTFNSTNIEAYKNKTFVTNSSTSSAPEEKTTNIRFVIWTAAIQAIEKQPIKGHGITQRFTSIRPYLPESHGHVWHSHSHNDVISSTVISGVFGGILAILYLISPVLFIMLTGSFRGDSAFLGVSFLALYLVTGITNTMIFNEVASAWIPISILSIGILIKESSPWPKNY